MSLLTALFDHEPQLFFKIGLNLWTGEVLRLCATCRRLAFLLRDKERAFELFRKEAGTHSVKQLGTQLYLHTFLSYDAARIYAAAIRHKLVAVSELVIDSDVKLSSLLDTISKSTCKMYYINFTFDLTLLHQGDCILSDNEIIDEQCRVRLQLRRITRVGLALAAEIETTPEVPLIRITANFEDQTFQLRAGARSIESLRAVDKKGFWSDLYPIAPEISEKTHLSLPCFVEMMDSW